MTVQVRSGQVRYEENLAFGHILLLEGWHSKQYLLVNIKITLFFILKEYV